MCKDQILSLQHPININTFFPFFSRREVVIFIKYLLHNHKVDFCKSETMKYPLDAALELHICSKLKAELLCVLLEYGAQIKCCAFPKKEKSSFLCIATKLAIESGKYIKYFTGENLLTCTSLFFLSEPDNLYLLYVI